MADDASIPSTAATGAAAAAAAATAEDDEEAALRGLLPPWLLLFSHHAGNPDRPIDSFFIVVGGNGFNYRCEVIEGSFDDDSSNWGKDREKNRSRSLKIIKKESSVRS